MRFRASTAALLITALAALGVGAYLWVARNSLSRQLVDAYLARLQPHLPMRIESVEWTATWRDLRRGRIPELRIELAREDWRVRLAGELRFARVRDGEGAPAQANPTRRPDELFAVTYRPQVELARGDFRANALPVELSAHVTSDLSRATRFAALLNGEHWKWAPSGLELRDPRLTLDWDGRRLRVESSVRELAYADPAAPESRLAQLGGIHLRAETDLALQSFALGPEVRGELRADGGELLWDETYFDLPLNELPLAFTAEIPGQKLTLEAPETRLILTADGTERLTAAWELRRLSLETALRRLAGWSWFSALASIELKGGSLTSRGAATLVLGSVPSLLRAKGRVEIRDLSARLAESKLRLQGLSARVPFEWHEPRGAARDRAKQAPAAALGLSVGAGELRGDAGELRIDSLHWRRLHGRLAPWRFTVREGRLETKTDLPLMFDALNLEVGPIEGGFGPAGRYRLHTHAEIRATELAPLLAAACVKTRIPPTRLRANFPGIHLTAASLQPDGELQLDTLGGRLLVRDLAVFDWTTPVPELGFDAEWGGFRLDELGDFLGFGKMDGTLTGHARNVVVQGWLPTQYDFQVQAKPSRKRDIVFSPEAMRNFVKLVTGQDLAAQFPGPLRWLYFGWPRRVTGGYDVYYAGVSLFSRDGSILLETLDHPRHLTKVSDRFILYGGRDFRMPLKSRRYPVVLDAPAVANYVRRMGEFFGELARQEKGNEPHESEESDAPCEPPPL